ncbi:outer membrane beta-barrel protein [Hymenobacter wooponensis]|uniref:outer membrane beta-barrel protein n=1 Tax=Hymenobacter wooponensis TaxID=1525360 RepID=UPI001436CBB4|nr:outer membrane beta-barrel protein [Hymenobacter wooponensis]
MRQVAFCGLLLTVPLVGLAQTAEPVPSRFYVGLSAYTSAYQRGSRQFGGNTLPPVQATLGYQLHPRLALQAGVAYNVGKGSVSGLSHDFNGNIIGDYRSVYRNATLSISALSRYTLTRTLSHRFQVDALGGFTLEHQTFQNSGYYTDTTQPNGANTYDLSSRRNTYLLTVGPSLRYRVSPKVELVGEGTINVEMRAPRNITTSGALGVRYRFGR